jgi:hypothetical protein
MVAPITIKKNFAAADVNYIADFNANFTTVEGIINAAIALLNGVVIHGADLLLDVFDRDGLVGAHSYVLDLDTYAGGATISIGRRPIFTPALGEQDVSVAYGTYGGARSRVTLTGDVVLDATAIIAGLPKTIYVGIPSNGTPQLYEDMTAISVLYAYSMTWDGFGLSDFKRITCIHLAYPTLQQMLGAPRFIQLFDNETDWTSETESASSVMLPGSLDSNELLDANMEVLGFFASFGKSGEDGVETTIGATGADAMLTLYVESEGDEWQSDDIEIPCDTAMIAPYTVMVGVAPAIGDDKYCVDLRNFVLKRRSIGASVVGARSFSWGVIVRPILGLRVPRDPARVDLM